MIKSVKPRGIASPVRELSATNLRKNLGGAVGKLLLRRRNRSGSYAELFGQSCQLKANRADPPAWWLDIRCLVAKKAPRSRSQVSFSCKSSSGVVKVLGSMRLSVSNSVPNCCKVFYSRLR